MIAARAQENTESSQNGHAIHVSAKISSTYSFFSDHGPLRWHVRPHSAYYGKVSYDGTDVNLYGPGGRR